MFFLDQRDTQPREWAEALWNAVKRSGRANPASFQPWLAQMVAARRRYGAGAVAETLAWYVEHVLDELLPACSNGKQFLDNFERLRRAMGAAEAVPATKELVSGDLNLVRGLLRHYDYPVEVEADLGQIVRVSRVHWAGFCAHLEKFRDATNRQRWHSFLTSVLNNHAPGFVLLWCGDYLSGRLHGIANYRSSTLALAFRPDHPKFREGFWRHWSRAWCCDPLAFEDLLTELLKREP